MPKDDDGMQDKLDGRVERVEVLGMINRIYRIEKVGRDHRYPPSVASRESGGYRGACRMVGRARRARRKER